MCERARLIFARTFLFSHVARVECAARTGATVFWTTRGVWLGWGEYYMTDDDETVPAAKCASNEWAEKIEKRANSINEECRDKTI